MVNLAENPWAVFSIAVVGSGFLVCMGMGITRMLNGNESEGVREQSNEQREYMAEVRRRYFHMLEFEARRLPSREQRVSIPSSWV